LTTPKGSIVATSQLLNCDRICLDNSESCSLMVGWTVLWSGRSAVSMVGLTFAQTLKGLVHLLQSLSDPKICRKEGQM
jgi:hypothetical protein